MEQMKSVCTRRQCILLAAQPLSAACWVFSHVQGAILIDTKSEYMVYWRSMLKVRTNAAADFDIFA